MITPQNLGPDFVPKLEKHLYSPVHSRMYDPAPLRINQAVSEGGSILKRVGVPEHTFSFQFLDGADEDEWRIDVLVSGYWRCSTFERLYYRGSSAPVWSMSMCGAIADSRIGDHPFADALFQFLMRTIKPSFERRKNGDSTFYPRGIELFEQDRWRYEADWNGGYDSFVGSERVMFENAQVWQARFSGQTLISKGFRLV